MLPTCIHHPKIFDKNLNPSSNFYYTHMYFYIDMIIRNGIILDNEKKEIFKVINQYINLWPQQHKKKIKEKIKKLEKNNRIVSIKADNKNTTDRECKIDNICDIFYSICNEKSDGIIIHNSCYSNINKDSNVMNIDDIEEKFYERLKKSSYTIDKDYDIGEFEEVIMLPIFKYCKSIKIIDRVFGNHIDSNRLHIKPNYRNGLENIVKMIVKSNKNHEKLNIEIYTSIHHKSTKIPEKMNVINTFISDLNKRHNVNITCYIKEQYGEINHDRYILTNQIGIHIGRGIDLFERDGKLSNTTISNIETEEKRKIETNIRSLADIILE